MTDMDDLRKSAPRRTLSDIDSELLNINFFETPTTFGDLQENYLIGETNSFPE